MRLPRLSLPLPTRRVPAPLFAPSIPCTASPARHLGTLRTPQLASPIAQRPTFISQRPTVIACPIGARAMATNRLINEKSPYLLQHARNPVDWFPWGPEALEKARNENKPVFLSVGYYSCHWCHVMEHESFEDDEIAALLNKYFVNVKVDREELPAVDRFYMTFVQATTGHGGWPMSVFLTPDLKPFFGGTYFPPRKSTPGSPSFTHVITHLGNMWQSDRPKILASANDILDLLKRNNESAAPSPVSREDFSATANKLAGWLDAGFDPKWGGFGHAPKFPTPPQLQFLCNLLSRDPESDFDLKQLLKHTLTQIAQGGIHDHLAGGFHRYSVDKEWHVPHFEKMAYDQGQLLSVYSTAALLCDGDSTLRAIPSDILGYLDRELRHPEGGFYCAQDADSLPTPDSKKSREGAFAVWTEKEIREVLVKGAGMGVKELEVFEYWFDVKSGGNVRPGPTDPHGELRGQNVLRVLHSTEEVAKKFGIEASEVERIVGKGSEELRKIRAERPKPNLDDKVLTAWNGLLVSGLAKSHIYVADGPSSDFLTRAKEAVEFIKKNLYIDGSLRRVYRKGPGVHGAVADDYSFLISGLLDLYEACVLSGDNQANEYLIFAAELQDKLDERFWDSVGGGYFTGAQNTDAGKIGEAEGFVLLRTKEDHDGAEPSPNSVALANLVRLEGIIPSRAGETSYAARAEKIVAAFKEQIVKYPQTMPYMVSAIEDWRSGMQHVVVKGKSGLEELRKSKVLARTVTAADEWTAKWNPRVKEVLDDGKEGVWGAERL